MNLRAMPRQDMKIISIHPRRGKVCHRLVFPGSKLILAEYLSVTFRNIRKKAARTKAVMSSSHHNFRDGIVMYARMPLTVMMPPGIPQRIAAM